MGGQYLDGAERVFFSGTGIHAEVIAHDKPPAQKIINSTRDKLRKVQDQVRAMRKKGEWQNENGRATVLRLADEKGLSIDELQEFAEYRRQQADPKRQLNPQIAETVLLKVTIASDALAGARDLRLAARSGLSNPMRFDVGQLKEIREPEPASEVTWENLVGLRSLGRRQTESNDQILRIEPPTVVNGQIRPSEIDQFSFEGKKGQRLVVTAKARALIPYLADAVPGWFQAVVSLHDAHGKEVAYADDYRFDPDPALMYDIPADGDYTIKIRDAIYRGREDFVYRLVLGQLPFVTSVFPLGGRSEHCTEVAVSGWNLPEEFKTLDVAEPAPGKCTLLAHSGNFLSNPISFDVDTLPESGEQEPNDNPRAAQLVSLPTIVNGRIDQSGDIDMFGFEGREGDQIVVEVNARRLNSPLDSVLRLIDATGRQLALNDDCSDPGAGLITHHADSQLTFTVPAHGVYHVQLTDAQSRGGPAYGYRLRLSSPRRGFELRMTPSTINARPGMTLPLNIHAMRRDGFQGDIMLRLKGAPPGFNLSGGWVPAGQDHVRITLSVPDKPMKTPARLRLEGHAVIDDKTVVREVIPSEDMMQAFFYKHLVPVAELLVNVKGPARRGQQATLVSAEPARIPAGGTATVELDTGSVNLMERFKFQLDSPPDGFEIKEIADVGNRLRITVASRSESAKPGLKGNLILTVYAASRANANARRRANQRRASLGALPAIPFEVVAP